jgi:DNA-binding response OmpR family regulator
MISILSFPLGGRLHYHPMARILLIDDDRRFAVALHDALEVAGHEVQVAHDGRTGIALYRRAPFDLVITDIYMPDKDGIETIIELRNEFSDVRIIAISGGGAVQFDQLPEAALLGAQRVLAKPFDLDRMLAAVREVLAS